MEAETSLSRAFERGSRLEALAAMPLFLLGVLTSLLNLLHVHVGIPMWIGNGLAKALALAMLIAFVIGLFKGLPRWSLPYTGMIGLNLSWVLTHRGTFMGMNTRAGLLGPLLGWTDRLFLAVMRPSHPWIVRAVVGAGWDWMVLLGLTAFTVLIVAAFRPLRPLYARLRDDWTLLSFGLYGATVMAVFYTFEDYPSARYPILIVSSLILADGAWTYIRSDRRSSNEANGSMQSPKTRPSRQALALFAAMVLTMTLGVMGRAIIFASPGRHYSHWPYYDGLTWYTEAVSAAILWAWVMAVVLAPALLTLLPRRSGPK